MINRWFTPPPSQYVHVLTSLPPPTSTLASPPRLRSSLLAQPHLRLFLHARPRLCLPLLASNRSCWYTPTCARSCMPARACASLAGQRSFLLAPPPALDLASRWLEPAPARPVPHHSVYWPLSFGASLVSLLFARTIPVVHPHLMLSVCSCRTSLGRVLRLLPLALTHILIPHTPTLTCAGLRSCLSALICVCIKQLVSTYTIMDWTYF